MDMLKVIIQEINENVLRLEKLGFEYIFIAFSLNESLYFSSERGKHFASKFDILEIFKNFDLKSNDDFCSLKKSGVIASHYDEKEVVNDDTNDNNIEKIKKIKSFNSLDKYHIIVESPDTSENQPIIDSKANCSLCVLTFKSKSTLRDHLRIIHGDNTPYKCVQCNKSYLSSYQLRRHNATEHACTNLGFSANVKVLCELCGAVFNESKQFQEHRGVHSKTYKEVFTCNTCYRKFKYKSKLQYHQKIVHSNTKVHLKKMGSIFKLYQKNKYILHSKSNLCYICGKSFAFSHYLYQHMVGHNEHRPYHCNDCGKSFKRLCILKEHMVLHGGAEALTFPCPKCGQTFRFASVLRQHMLVHRDVRPFSCATCHKSFNKRLVLKRHVCSSNKVGRRHHKDASIDPVSCDAIGRLKTENLAEDSGGGVLGFQCEICSKSFALIKSLKKHAQIHSDLRPYVCALCKKSFKHSSSLRQHQSVHSEERPYLCNHCPKRFKNSTGLRQHLDKYRYKCCTCGRTYMHLKSLRLHSASCVIKHSDPQSKQQNIV